MQFREHGDRTERDVDERLRDPRDWVVRMDREAEHDLMALLPPGIGPRRDMVMRVGESAMISRDHLDRREMERRDWSDRERLLRRDRLGGERLDLIATD